MNIARSKLMKIFKRCKLYIARKYVFKAEGKHLSSIKLARLTKQEKQLIHKQWDGLGLKIYEDFFRMYKTIDTFNPLYLSDDLYYPYVIRKLNPIEYCSAFCHKGFYDIFFPNAHKPKTYVTRIRGTYFDGERNILSETEAMTLASKCTPFIIKPTINTSVGKNVHKITDCSDVNIYELFSSVGQDFIVQEVLEQSAQTAALNKNSLNTIRISTLYINNKFSVCNMCIRMGRNNAIVDNLGAGGLMLGINKDSGALCDFAYDNKYHKYYQNGDFVFSGKRLEGYDKVKKFVERLHTSYLPHLSFVGWDIALDKNNEPTLIEVNLIWPGIQFEQLSTATPIFGERTNEVIAYLNNMDKK